MITTYSRLGKESVSPCTDNQESVSRQNQGVFADLIERRVTCHACNDTTQN